MQIEERRLFRLKHPAADAVAQFFVGMSVGVIATCFNAPFDVVKSRVQVGMLGFETQGFA
jgi:hypothetical protein